jgi:hypothetical protein
VAALALAKGRPLIPWQRQALEVALEVDPDTGDYFYGIVVVSVQRQTGKTTIVGDLADHRCLSVRDARVWFTQQTGKHASEWMREEYLPRLDRLDFFKGHYKAQLRGGSEGVRWHDTGSTFYVFAPKEDGLHSKQSDLVVVDEAWAHDEAKGRELKQAIRPTMLTRKGAQLWVVSAGGTDESAYLQEYIDLGVSALEVPGTRVALVDYGIPPDADPEDLDTIAAWHPGFGHLFDMDALLSARLEFGADIAGFARAYGNRHTRTTVAAFPAGAWETCGGPMPTRPARAGIAYDVTPLGDRVAIAAAWRTGDHAHLEVIYEGSDVRTAPDRLAQLARTYTTPVGYDTAGAATLAVADELKRRHPGIRHAPLTTMPYATACAALSAEVLTNRLRHHRQPALDTAVAVASRRPIGDGGWGWGRRVSAGNIAPLVAGTVALRTHDDLPATPTWRIITANPQPVV